MRRSFVRLLRTCKHEIARGLDYVGPWSLLPLAAALLLSAESLDIGKSWTQALLWLLAGIAATTLLVWLRRTTIRDRNEVLAEPLRRVRQAAAADVFHEIGVEREVEEALEAVGQDGPHAEYLARDVDGELRARLAEALKLRRPSLVVLSGPPRAGKSRTVAEAAIAVAADAWLIVPRDAAAVAKLARERPPVPFVSRGACVIWLDDIERFVRARGDGLNAELLTAFERWGRPVVILGTAGGKGLRFSRNESQQNALAQGSLLQQHQRLVLDDRLSGSELDALQASPAYNATASEAMKSIGIGEFMLAATRKRLLLDVPSEQPVLRVEPVAKALRDIVVQSDPRFAIGIFGGWGSGKTTLMRAIEKRLRERNVICVPFVAWRYEKEEHLIVPLLDAIREALVTWAERNDQDAAARQTAATIGRVVRSILAGVTLQVGLPGAMKASFAANQSLQEYGRMRGEERDRRVPRSFYHASFVALQSAFSQFVGAGSDRRIAVFVDDLDRCLPENALQILESMKLFFDLDGFVFIVGLDQDVIEYAVEKRYGSKEAKGDDDKSDGRVTRISGAEYIKKIFQLPYRLDPVSEGDLAAFVRAASDEAGLPDEQKGELREVVEPHLRYLAREGAINPREVKRYINLYTLQSQVHEDLDPSIVLAVQTLSFRQEWRDKVWLGLLEFRDEYVDAVRRRLAVAGDPSHQDLPGEFEEFPDDFLKYVADGAPGHVLLQTADLNRYLSAGEAVRPTRNADLLEALGLFGQVRVGLNAARSGDVTADLADALSSRLSKVAVAVTKAAGGSDPIVAALRSLRQDVSDATSGLVPDELPQAAELERRIGPVAKRANELSLRLRQLYREGDLRSAGSGGLAGAVTGNGASEHVEPPAGPRSPPPRPAPEVAATRLDQLSPAELGVAAATGGSAPYVARDADAALGDALDAALEPEGPTMIVVTGPRKAGKTRTLYEALTAHPKLAHAVVVTVDDAGALLDVLDPVSIRRLPPGPVVVWLGDLDRFSSSGAGMLRPEAVTALGRLPRRVIAAATTLPTLALGELARHPDVRSVQLDRTLSERELETFRELYHVKADDPVGERGIAGWLAGATRLAQTLEAAESLEGAAVVRAAIDWTRTGMRGPIPEGSLRLLWPYYYSAGEPTDERFAAGLAWALEPVDDAGALLVSADGGYLASEWVVDRTHALELDHRVWQVILDQAAPDQALRLGVEAAARLDDDRAAEAFARAERSERPDIAAAAMLQSGYVLARTGDDKGAESAFRRADSAGNVAATNQLGVLLERRGDRSAALAAFRRADDRGDPKAATHLGELLLEQDDVDGAIAAFRRADERGDIDGTLQLADALTRKEDIRGAEHAYRRADERGSPDGALSLGLLLEQRGDVEGALAALRRADERRSADGALHLADLLAERGDFDLAVSAYRRALERGATNAADGLARLAQARGGEADAGTTEKQARAEGPDAAERPGVLEGDDSRS